MPPSKLQAHLKRLQGVMLISVCQGTFADAVRLSSRCNTNCKLHTDEGDGCFFGFAFEGFCAFVRRGCNVIATRCKGCAFAFVRFCFVRFRAVCGCLFAVCAAFIAFAILFHLARFCAFMWLVLYCSSVCCSLFGAPSVRRFNEPEGQIWMTAGDKPTAAVGAFIAYASLLCPAAVFPREGNCGRRRGQ